MHTFPTSNPRHLYGLFLALLLLLNLPFGEAQKISDGVLRDLQTAEEADVILRFETLDMRPATAGLTDKTAKGSLVYWTLKEHARQTQTQVIQQLTKWGVTMHPHWASNMIATRLNARQIQRIAQYPEVLQITSDAPISFAPPKPSDERGIQLRGAPLVTWGIKRIQADSVWAMGIRGKGVVVGGQDTGYKWDIEGIKDNYRGYEGGEVDHNFNWHDAISEYDPNNSDSVNLCGLNLHAPCDDHGHGTHTMGTMVGEVDTIKYGVAPEAQWIGCRCMERGWGKPSSYIDCFEWFIAPTDTSGLHPDPSAAPHVINNSWGCPTSEGCTTDNFAIMNEVVNNVKAAGIVVVVSAGNDGGRGCATIENPAAIFKSSFTVGALHPNDTIARFSSRGPVLSDGSNRTKPDITAPGVRVLSQLKDSTFRAWNGTSMAGPHVAGVVALMISANSTLAGQVDAIQDIITATAERKYSAVDSCDIDPMTVPNNVYGYGVIDALAAVRMALEWRTTATGSGNIIQNIRVSPNPTRDLLHFESIAHDQSIESIEFTTLWGEVLDIFPVRHTMTKWTIDLSSLPQGIYLYHLKTNTTGITGRAIKI